MSHPEGSQMFTEEEVYEKAKGILHEAAEKHAAPDRSYMEAVARAEERDRLMARISTTGALREAAKMDEDDPEWTARTVQSLKNERDGYFARAREVQTSAIFHRESPDYSPAREAITWLAETVGGWKRGGEPTGEQLAKSFEEADSEAENPLDEQLLRAMEESSMQRVRVAVEAGIPQDIRSSFAETLREFARLADNTLLKEEARKLAENIEQKKKKT